MPYTIEYRNLSCCTASCDAIQLVLERETEEGKLRREEREKIRLWWWEQERGNKSAEAAMTEATRKRNNK